MANPGMEKTHPILAGAAAASIVFVVGFVALALFWHLGSYPSGLPGFYSYYAATWGDGLFLPIGAFGLVSWFALKLQDNEINWKVVAALACIFAVIGICMQAQWLISDSTELNWTIPEKHHFNAPGWYHAVFFVAALAFFGAGLFLFLGYRLKWTTAPGAIEPISEFSIWFGASGYLAMHFHDDAPAYLATLFGVALPSLMVLAVGAVVLFLLSMYEVLELSNGELSGRPFADVGPSVAALTSSLALSIGVSALILGGGPAEPTGWFFILALTLISMAPFAFTGKWHFLRFFGILASGVGSALAVLNLEAVAGGRGTAALAAPLVALALYWVTVWVCKANSTRNFGNRCARGSVLYGASILYAIFFVSGFGANGDADTLLYSITLLVAAYYAKYSLVPLQIAERQRRIATTQGKPFERVAWPHYAPLVCVVLGLVVLFLFQIGSRYHVGLDTADALAMFRQATSLVMPPSALCAVSLAAFIIIGVRANKKGAAGIFQLILLGVMYVSLVAAIARCKSFLPLSPELLWCYLLAAIVSVGLAAFMTEAFVSNVALIRECPRSRDWRLALEAILLFFGCAAVCLVSIVPTATPADPGWKALLFAIPGFLGSAVGFVVVPAIVASGSVWRENNAALDCYIVENSPSGGVLQNGFSAWAVALLFGVFALQLILCLNAVSGLITFVAAVATGYAVMRSPFESNRAFLRGSIALAATGAPADRDPVETLRRLSRHFQRQAILMAAALFPWSLLHWVGAAVRSDRPPRASLRRELLLRWGEPSNALALMREWNPDGLAERRLIALADEVLGEQV